MKKYFIDKNDGSLIVADIDSNTGNIEKVNVDEMYHGDIIRRIHFIKEDGELEDGTSVKKGDVILVLVDRNYQNKNKYNTTPILVSDAKLTEAYNKYIDYKNGDRLTNEPIDECDRCTPRWDNDHDNGCTNGCESCVKTGNGICESDVCGELPTETECVDQCKNEHNCSSIKEKSNCESDTTEVGSFTECVNKCKNEFDSDSTKENDNCESYSFGISLA